VLVTDLEDPRRLLVLLEQAQRRGDVGRSESERLKFFAAAEHAVRHERQNPAGLFATIVRRGLWRYASAEDEDRARQMLRALPGFCAAERSLPSRPGGVAHEGLSPKQIAQLIPESLASADVRETASAMRVIGMPVSSPTGPCSLSGESTATQEGMVEVDCAA
jgi:hypothetical protein